MLLDSWTSTLWHLWKHRFWRSYRSFGRRHCFPSIQAYCLCSVHMYYLDHQWVLVRSTSFAPLRRLLQWVFMRCSTSRISLCSVEIVLSKYLAQSFIAWWRLFASEVLRPCPSPCCHFGHTCSRARLTLESDERGKWWCLSTCFQTGFETTLNTRYSEDVKCQSHPWASKMEACIFWTIHNLDCFWKTISWYENKWMMSWVLELLS